MQPDYRVDVEPFNDEWKVVWTANNLAYSYFVSAQDIQDISDRIRALLEKLVKISTQGKLAQGHRAAAVPVLDALMAEGNRLYDTFFTDTRYKTQKKADHVRQALAARRDRPHIWFKVNSGVHVPWALMSEAPAPAGALDGGIDGYRALWALKYSVATVYEVLLTPEDFDEPYPASAFETLMGADTYFLGRAGADLTVDDPETQLFTMLAARFNAPVTSSHALRSEWDRRHPQLGLLYLYCHSNQKTVGFSQTDVLSAIDFKRFYKKVATPPRCLVFLNGCHTAAGNFLEATGRPGFCGFIGAETLLPYLFGHRFGAAVIASLYAGEPLVDIIDRLREQHWPLSLVYGLYAYPFLRLVKEFDTPEMSRANYSDLAVGNQTL